MYMNKVFFFFIVSIFLSANQESTKQETKEKPFSFKKLNLYEDSELSKIKIEKLITLANNKNPYAQNELGRRYGVGESIEKDSVKSFHLYKASALQNIAIAQANLAYMYFNGEGVEKNLQLAYEWNLKAANQGHFTGQHMLGYMYITGIGVKKDANKAIKWFLKAANQGHIDSQTSLYYIYLKGDGVEKDIVKATLWLFRVNDAQKTGNTWKKQ